MTGSLFVAQRRSVICSETEKLFGYDSRLFHSTSPEDFKTRLEEHHKQESVEKQRCGENRKFSSLSDPKEEIAKCPSPAFTRQKVRTFLFMNSNVKKCKISAGSTVAPTTTTTMLLLLLEYFAIIIVVRTKDTSINIVSRQWDE
jgi:hypothetical protein